MTSIPSIERGQLRRFGKRIGVELSNPDFVQFAESFGAVGLRVEDPNDFKADRLKRHSLWINRFSSKLLNKGVEYA